MCYYDDKLLFSVFGEFSAVSKSNSLRGSTSPAPVKLLPIPEPIEFGRESTSAKRDGEAAELPDFFSLLRAITVWDSPSMYLVVKSCFVAIYDSFMTKQKRKTTKQASYSQNFYHAGISTHFCKYVIQYSFKNLILFYLPS